MASKNSNQINVPQAREAMDKFKMQAAQEMGVNLKQGYNGDLTSREAGSVGGQMVKKMCPVQSASYARPARTAIGHEVNVRYMASIAIDTTAVENEVADSTYQRSELDWLIYNAPLEYAQLVLDGGLEEYAKGTPEHRLMEADKYGAAHQSARIGGLYHFNIVLYTGHHSCLFGTQIPVDPQP